MNNEQRSEHVMPEYDDGGDEMSITQSTITNLILYIILMAIGALLGRRQNWGERFCRWLGKLQLIALFLLILAL